MQFTKPMIELVFEIRRCTPSDLKPSVKLANPDLFPELQKHFHEGASVVCKTLIKELFAMAGDPWPERLLGKNEAPRQSVHVYRGQVTTDDSAPKSTETDEQQKKRKKRVYRGQVIYE